MIARRVWVLGDSRCATTVTTSPASKLIMCRAPRSAVRRALLSDELLLASPWREFYEVHLVPLVQECVRDAFDGGSLKLQPLVSVSGN